MKDNIINAIKIFLLLFAMILGFFLTYSFIWYVVGLPLTDWALWLCLILSGLTEWAYIEWVTEL